MFLKWSHLSAQPAVTSIAYVTAPPSSNSAVEAFSKDSAATIAAKQPLPAVNLHSLKNWHKISVLRRVRKETQGTGRRDAESWRQGSFRGDQSPISTIIYRAWFQIISNTTLSPATYVKEAGYLTAPPTPSPYLPRPLPYRPHPYLPAGLIFPSPEKAPVKSVLGCPVLPPQYLKPIPYYPRGYVQPIPLPTQIPQPGRGLGFLSRKFDFQLLYPIPIHPTINLRWCNNRSDPSTKDPSWCHLPSTIAVEGVPHRVISNIKPMQDPFFMKIDKSDRFQALGMKTANEKVDLKKPGNSTNHQSFVPRRNKLKEDQSDVKCTSEKLKNLINKVFFYLS